MRTAQKALLRRAEQAMFEAKRARQHVVVYNPGLEASRELHLSCCLTCRPPSRATSCASTCSPRHLRSGRVVGVEALGALAAPERGWLPPSEFVPFAESSGRIRLITQWMLTRAAQTLARWQAEGVDLYIAVNVTTLDIQGPWAARAGARRAGRVPRGPAQAATRSHRDRPDGQRQRPHHRDARAAPPGVRLAIDDFGTGPVLAWLSAATAGGRAQGGPQLRRKRPPRPQAPRALSAIVGIGHSLGLTVTGEGVETVEELGVVGDCGCDLVQGFHVARPLDPDDFEAWRRDPRQRRAFPRRMATFRLRLKSAPFLSDPLLEPSMGNKIVTEADRRASPPRRPKGVTFTTGKGQKSSLERGSHTRSKKNPGKRPHSG